MLSLSQQRLLTEFASASDLLLDLGVIRSDSFWGEIAEYLACRALKLTLATRSTAHFDAYCVNKRRYQIKSKIASKSDTQYRFTPRNPLEVDFLVVVWYDQKFVPQHISCASINGEQTKILKFSAAPDDEQIFTIKSLRLPATVKDAINDFRELFWNLLETGIVRSTRIVGDIGELFAAKHLTLTLAENINQKGYDAIDTNEVRYEIKTRRIYESDRRTSRVRRLNNFSGKSADVLIVVALDREFRCAGMWSIPYQNVAQLNSLYVTIVNKAEGVKCLVPSTISWLVGHVEDDYQIERRKTPRKLHSTMRKRSPDATKSIIITNKEAESSADEPDTVHYIHQQQLSKSSGSGNSPAWLIVIVVLAILLLYIFTLLR
jgi:hypothetical protein